MGVDTDTGMDTDTGVIDNTYGCWYGRSYRCSKDRLSLWIVLKPFIFFAHRMHLWLVIRVTQEEAGEHIAMYVYKGIGVLLTTVHCNSLVHSYLPTDDHTLVYWPKEDWICQKQSLRLSNDPINRAVNVPAIDTLKPFINFLGKYGVASIIGSHQ